MKPFSGAARDNHDGVETLKSEASDKKVEFYRAQNKEYQNTVNIVLMQHYKIYVDSLVAYFGQVYRAVP